MSPQAARTSLSREQLQKVLLGVIIAIALVAGFWQLVLKPTALKRKKVERDIMVQQKEHQKNKNLVEAAAKIEASYTAARERLRQIMADSVPPQTNATAWANDRLNEHTRAKGIPLDLQAINEAGVDRPMTVRGGPVPLFEDYLINAELTGGYHSLGRFLASIESTNPIVRVGSLDVRRDPQEPTRLAISLGLAFPRLTEDGFPESERPDAAEPRVVAPKGETKPQ